MRATESAGKGRVPAANEDPTKELAGKNHAKGAAGSQSKPTHPNACLWIPQNYHELGLGLPTSKVPRDKAPSLGALSEPFWSRLYAAQRWVVYEPDESRFYRYIDSNGAWDGFDVELLRKDLVEGIEAAARLWKGYGPMKYLCTERNLRGIIELLKGEVHSQRFFANRPTHCIHAANCMLIFGDGENGQYAVRSFSPHYCSRNPSPFDFTAEAQCPDFHERMLKHLQEDTRALLQKYAGQCLLGFNHSQTILLLNGVADSSKTEFIRLIAALVGRQNTEELRTEFLSERFEIGRFAGKTLLTGADVPADFLKTRGAHALKKLVGGDILTGELKSSNRNLQMYGHFNVPIGSNSTLLIKLEGDLGAWTKRILIADFKQSFGGDKIESIHEWLLAKEGSGIFKWALDGAVALLADLRGSGKIVLSERQRGLVKNLLMASDSLKLFLQGELVKTADSDNTLTTDEIYAAYAAWCIERTWSVASKDSIAKLIPSLMEQIWSITRSHDLVRPGTKSLRGYHFIRFRKPDESDEP